MALSFLDAVRLTLSNYAGDGSFATIMPRHRFVIMDGIWREGRPKPIIGGGSMKWEIAYKEGASTKWVKPAAVRNPELTEYTVEATLPLVNCYYQVSYVEHEQEINRNGTPEEIAAQIVDVVKMRRQQEKLGFYVEQESKFWALPVTTGNNLTPHGFFYHFPPITGAQVTAGTGSGAHQGTFASGSTDWCGIDRSTAQYAALKSYNAAWDITGASVTTFTINAENRKRLARLLRRLNFQGPMEMSEIKEPQFDRLRVWADEYVIEALGAATQQQNDALGSDVLKYLDTGLRLGVTGNGTPILNGLPVRWAEDLDTADTTNRGYHPLCVANLDYYRLAYRRDKFQKVRPPATDAVHQPDVVTEFIDSEINYRVDDPQKAGGLISGVVAA